MAETARRRIRTKERPFLPATAGSARPRSTGRTVVALLIACLGVITLKAAVSSGSGGGEVRRLALGEGAATSQGNEITVSAWNAQAASGPDRSELRFQACRSKADQPLVSAGAFSLEMPGGTSLEPEGSNLKVDGNCVNGSIFFAGTEGTTPRAAVYDRGSVTLHWALDGQ